MSTKYHVFERGVPLNKELRDHMVIADDPLGAAIVYAVVAMGLYHASRESYYDVYDIKGEKTEVALPSYVGPQFASSLKKAFHIEVEIDRNPVGPGESVIGGAPSGLIGGLSMQAGPGVGVYSGAAAQKVLTGIGSMVSAMDSARAQSEESFSKSIVSMRCTQHGHEDAETHMAIIGYGYLNKDMVVSTPGDDCGYDEGETVPLGELKAFVIQSLVLGGTVALGSCQECEDEPALEITMSDGTVFGNEDVDEVKDKYGDYYNAEELALFYLLDIDPKLYRGSVT